MPSSPTTQLPEQPDSTGSGPAMRTPGSGDRLAATLALALIAHGIVILGVGFAVDPPAPVRPTLEVILTQPRNDTPPKQADFLAQSSQTGGGESQRVERPAEPQSAVLPKPEPGLAKEQQLAQAPPEQELSHSPMLTSTQGVEPEPLQTPEPAPEIPLATGRELFERSLEMARLAAELEREQALYAKQPRRKYISASTREFEWAAYMRAWVLRVERVGNLNYPDEARRRDLEGSLILTVGIRRDGSVESIDLVRSSGHPLLDEAAIRTVHLAEPFAPLPQTSEKIEVLHLTRTWRYLSGGTLSQQP